MTDNWQAKLDSAVEQAFPGVECKTEFNIFAGMCGGYVTSYWQAGTEDKKLKPSLARQVQAFVRGFMACYESQQKYHGYPLRFNLYRDLAGKWRWNLTAKNNRIVADSAEGYVRKGTMLAQVNRIIADAQHAAIEVDTSGE